MNADTLTNREMAAVMFNIATILRAGGNENPFRTAAYERAGRALMGLGTEARHILEYDPQVPFRRRQHIGKKLQAKIREMAATGRLEQYAELVRQELPPYAADLMRVPGVGPVTARRIYETLGVTTAEGLVRAARDGSLRAVPGFGPRRIQGVIAAGRALLRSGAGERVVQLTLPC
jgi:DNA polymerase IV (family X)